MDIYTIKRRTQERYPYFFDKNTMEFFGQKMSDFKVHKLGEKYLIIAPSKYGNYTKRLFNPVTNELERV